MVEIGKLEMEKFSNRLSGRAPNRKALQVGETVKGFLHVATVV